MLKEKINQIIEKAEEFKNSYFWNSPSKAAMRRAYEEKNSIPEIAWEEGGNTYTAQFDVVCSARNIYARGFYTRNGKKTTLTAIKNSLARLA